MATYNIHAGHGLAGGVGCGAVGILDESTEARKVKTELIRLLKYYGNTCYDCTYEGNASQNTILSNIVTKCNQHNVDLDISIHLNSGRGDSKGDGSTGGIEVYGYSDSVKDIANKICENVSNTLNIRNRGFKINKSLYVLKKTTAKAILIECCFVDDKDDADHWNAINCASAIAQALGVNLTTTTTQKIQYKYKVGDKIVISSHYKNANDDINSAVYLAPWLTMQIVGIENGARNPYHTSFGTYCNDGDIRELYNETTTSSVAYYSKYTGTSASFVDALKALGIDSSFTNRTKIAAKNGIASYAGNSSQNTALLKLLKQGKLIKA